MRLSAKRIATKNTHGTGCTLSSAIAAGLAKGRDLIAATQDAKAYVTAAIAAADSSQVGHGHGPLHHFHAQRRSESGNRFDDHAQKRIMTTRRTHDAAGATRRRRCWPRRRSRARRP